MTHPLEHPPEVPDPTKRSVINVQEVAAVFGISEWAAYQAVRAGEIPSIRIGSRVLIPTAPLRRMLGLDRPMSLPGEDPSVSDADRPMSHPGEAPSVSDASPVDERQP